MANHRLDFPNPATQTPVNEFSPTSTPASTNGVVYNWDGVKWVAFIPMDIESGASVEVGETPPPVPEVGDLWWDSSDDSGRLFVWYDDGDTSQWVDASPDSLGHSVNSGENWPSVANENDLFFRTSDGRLYIYYKDDDSSQWIDASPDSPASELWVKSGSDLSPAEDTDNVVIGGGNISLRANGRSDFYYPSASASDGVLRVSSDNGGTKTLKWFVDSSGTQKCGGDAANAPNITLRNDGAGIFGTSGGTNGAIIVNQASANAGAFAVNGASGATKFYVYGDGKTDIIGSGSVASPVISMQADGKTYIENYTQIVRRSAANGFNDVIMGLGGSSGSFPSVGTTIGIGCNDMNQPGVGCFFGGNGNAYFSGTTNAFGLVLNLEADDDTKYTSTTDADGNETRVYNGTVLDVKERVLNLVARLDAIEANEMIDDATDTSLLQLLASANARIDSIEQRLAALEGVSN